MDIDELLKKMTIEDKIALTMGKNFWYTLDLKKYGIESKMLTDGPHGIRKQVSKCDHLGLNDSQRAISYPCEAALASTYDLNLAYRLGHMMGKEASYLDVDMILGPGLNIKRHPLAGRNFEYFSEDPILSGLMGKALIKGIEEENVGACPKHFALNSQETKRLISNSISTKKTMRELYLRPFEIAIESHPEAIMAAYNKVNNEYAAENAYLLKEVLRDDLKFDGFVVSDWGGVSDPVLSLKNGLSLEMPGVDKTRNKWVYNAYKKKLISESEIDDALRPLLKFLLKEKKPKEKFNYEDGIKMSYEVALKSEILLKNENILPLNKKEKVLFVGSYLKEPRFTGNGSSKVNPVVVDSLYEALISNKIQFGYKKFYNSSAEFISNTKLSDIKDYDKVVMMVALPSELESEGYDRESLALPLGYKEAFDKIYKENQNIVVIIQSGSIVDLSYFKEAKGIVFSYLLGSKGGKATYDLLYGNKNFEGRLAETYVNDISDTYLKDKFPIKDKNVLYTEGVYVGYPYYFKENIDVLYPFGYGLSYSRFNYSNFKYENDIISFEASNDLKSGVDTLFLFVKDKNNYIRLKDFKKISLASLKTGKFEFKIEKKFFKSYDEKLNKFVVSSGEFEIIIGKNVNDKLFSFNYQSVGEENYQFKEYDLSLKAPKEENKYTINSTMADIKDNHLARIIYKKLLELNDPDKAETLMHKRMALTAIEDNPLRFYAMYNPSPIDRFKVEALIEKLNKNELKALKYRFSSKLLKKDEKEKIKKAIDEIDGKEDL